MPKLQRLDSQQVQLKSADLRKGDSSPYPESGLWIRMNDFQNLVGNFLSKHTSVVNFS